MVQDELGKILSIKLINKFHRDWNSSSILVPKAQRVIWFCADYQVVNMVSKVNPYPMLYTGVISMLHTPGTALLIIAHYYWTLWLLADFLVSKVQSYLFNSPNFSILFVLKTDRPERGLEANLSQVV